MKNLKTSYRVDGSSALKTRIEENIIVFPAHAVPEVENVIEEKTFLNRIQDKVLSQVGIQQLLAGSIKGKPFHKAKTWQTALTTTFFFAFAVACIYFGR